MKVLLLGSGGREHAIAWKLSQSNKLTQLFVAPGNGGTQEIADNVNLNIQNFEEIKLFCQEQEIDMLVVGPEDPLVNGIYDFFEGSGIHLIGPSQAAAQLEGSKAFAKEFMQRHNIPTATYQTFSDENFTQGLDYLKNHQGPYVLKADGLAAGKGVLIIEDRDEAIEEYRNILSHNKFGSAGNKVVIEQFLQGIEFSVFVLTDGDSYKILPLAKDYKRIGDGDTGLNTGGMGAVSPVPFVDEMMLFKVEEKIIKPTIKGLQAEKLDYKGFIFFGLIKVNNEPYVIEYNCRMGDPETEVVMPRLKSDLLQLFHALSEGRLADEQIIIDEKAACGVVVCSGGYPGSYTKGYDIKIDAIPNSDSLIFHAGTKQLGEHLSTAGGRVMVAVSLAESLPQAIKDSRELADSIHFDFNYHRKDIGWEFE